MLNLYKSTLIILAGMLILSSYAGSNKKKSSDTINEAPDLNTRIHWIENKGQYDQSIRFALQNFSSKVLVKSDHQISYLMKSEQNWIELYEKPFNATLIDQSYGENKTGLSLNFLKGTRDMHLTGIPSYQGVNLGVLWPGVELKLSSVNQTVEKILKVSPYADPAQIRFDMKGMEEMCINSTDELQLDMTGGESIFFSKPVAWQFDGTTKKMVDISYDLLNKKRSYGFNLGKFNPKFPLFIDPLLSSGFVGGSLMDRSQHVKIGRTGNVYIGGTTESVDLEITPDAFDPEYNDTTDIFLAVFSPDLRELLQCTFIGGSKTDYIHDMTLDSLDNLYFTGSSASPDYPVTSNAYDTVFNDLETDWFHDMIISAMSSDLTTLNFSSYIGNKGDDSGTAIDLDSKENIILTGRSINGLTPVGPQLYDHVTGQCVLVKMDHSLSQLLATNAIWADNQIPSRELVIDSSDNVFILGDTWATDLPVSPDCYADTTSGKRDLYVIRLNNEINQILACTYMGGKDDEFGFGIITDSTNHVYITGNTASENFPVSDWAFDQINDMSILPSMDAFIAKLDSNLSKLEASSLLGGYGNETAYDLALDSMGNLFVTGFTSSEKFPVFCNSFQDRKNLLEDAFISKLSPKLDSLMASTYIGGRGTDQSFEIELNDGDTVYITGYTNSEDFPARHENNSTYLGGPGDGFFLAIDPELDQHYPCCSDLLYPSPNSVGIPGSFILRWDSIPSATDYLIKITTSSGSSNYDNLILEAGISPQIQLDDLPCGDTISLQIQPINENGILFDDSEIVFECNTNWFVIDKDYYFIDEAEICEGDVYDWQGNQYDTSGIFMANYNSINGCDSIYELNLNVHPSFSEGIFAEICEGENFEWEQGFFDVSGIYYYLYNTIHGCDSTIWLDLTVRPGFEINQQANICDGEIYNWEGMYLNAAGNYSIAYPSQYNCDSIIHLNLTVDPSYYYTDIYQICEGDSILWQGDYFSTAGFFTASYQTTEGCDSSYSLELIVLPNYETFEYVSICQGENYLWEGMDLSLAGNYKAEYFTQYQCDSTIYLELAVEPLYAFYDTLSVCDGDSILYQNNYYGSAGDFFVNYLSVSECDSSYFLNVQEQQSYLFEENKFICEGEFILWHNILIDSAGYYEVNYNSSNGCDSIYQLELMPYIPELEVYAEGDTLYVDDSAESYQWVSCPEMTLITDENEPSYIADSTGSYAVIIQTGACIDTSDCYQLIHTNALNLWDQNISVYPNPVFGKEVSILISGFDKTGDYSIINSGGQKVLRGNMKEENTIVDLSGIKNGIYFLRLTLDGSSYTKKIIVIR